MGIYTSTFRKALHSLTSSPIVKYFQNTDDRRPEEPTPTPYSNRQADQRDNRDQKQPTNSSRGNDHRAGINECNDADFSEQRLESHRTAKHTTATIDPVLPLTDHLQK